MDAPQMPKTLARKSENELVDDANSMGRDNECVFYRNVLYMPVDFEDGYNGAIPEPERKTWIPLTPEAMRVHVQAMYGTIFSAERKSYDFAYMVQQTATQISASRVFDTLLIRTPTGLRELRPDGTLHEPTGEFVPNTLPVMLNEDPADKMEVWSVLREWVGGENEDVQSLLHHLATALAPHWSAVRYVLLLGSGRNGKSVLLGMLQKLFGVNNCSQVTRQNISDGNSPVLALNGKLVNIVFDGVAKFLKDSGNEKSLIAGEPIQVRRLYASDTTTVMTNSLFIEGLNKEPRSSDKTQALQARLVRFQFPNTYEQDDAFSSKMWSDAYVGALMSLLIDNYVLRTEKQQKLAITQTQLMLKMEHLESNSQAVQFIEHFVETSTFGSSELIGMESVDLYDQFRSWRIRAGDFTDWPNAAIASQFADYVNLSAPKSERRHGKVAKVRRITSFTSLGQQVLDNWSGASHAGAAVEQAVVDD